MSFEKIGKQLGALTDKKNAAYGDSFGKSGDILKILYPDGVKPDQYTDMLCIVRIIDKLFRIATHKHAFGESPYADLVGYGLLGLSRHKLFKPKKRIMAKKKPKKTRKKKRS